LKQRESGGIVSLAKLAVDQKSVAIKMSTFMTKSYSPLAKTAQSPQGFGRTFLIWAQTFPWSQILQKGHQKQFADEIVQNC
jgi:hypothetical protein